MGPVEPPPPENNFGIMAKKICAMDKMKEKEKEREAEERARQEQKTQNEGK